MAKMQMNFSLDTETVRQIRTLSAFLDVALSGVVKFAVDEFAGYTRSGASETDRACLDALVKRYERLDSDKEEAAT